MIISAIVAVIIFFSFHSLNWIFVAFILVGGVLPDLIEPARHPSHRRFFHSWTFLGACAIAMLIILPFGLSNENYLIPLFTILGYSLHLLADATTPKGLPRR